MYSCMMDVSYSSSPIKQLIPHTLTAPYPYILCLHVMAPVARKRTSIDSLSHTGPSYKASSPALLPSCSVLHSDAILVQTYFSFLVRNSRLRGVVKRLVLPLKSVSAACEVLFVLWVQLLVDCDLIILFSLRWLLKFSR